MVHGARLLVAIVSCDGDGIPKSVLYQDPTRLRRVFLSVSVLVIRWSLEERSKRLICTSTIPFLVAAY